MVRFHNCSLVRRNGELVPATWSDFEGFAKTHFGRIREARGRGLAVVSEATSSVTNLDVRRRFEAAYPEARWCEYEPLGRQQAAQAAGVEAICYACKISLDGIHIAAPLPISL